MELSKLKLDNNISKILENEQPSNWVHALDKQDKEGKKLITFLHALAHSGSQSAQTCTLVNQAIQQISVRKLAPHLEKKFQKAVTKASILGDSILKPLDKSYIPEAAGIPQKAIGGKSTQRVHIHKEAIKPQFDLWKGSGTSKPFGKWIEAYANESEKKKMQKNCVKYLSKTEAQKHIVSFHNKKLKQNGRSIKNGEYIYVLDAKMQTLFLGKKIKGEFHHSSFTGGTPVACAGGMQIQNGKIKKINLHSGHYQPTKQQGENLLNFLSHSKRLGTEANRFSF